MSNPDLISTLPDPILHHILGFLRTKEAVRTCVLSKRWEHLWTSLRCLHFDPDDFIQPNQHDKIVVEGYELERTASEAETERFINFVNMVLLKREPLDLDVFLLCCTQLDWEDNEQLGEWISYAVKHRTRVFHLSGCYFLPSCIYTSMSIEELHLSTCEVDIPGTVNLPKLKKLVICHWEESLFPINILSGCLILEYLELDYYILPDVCVIAHEYLKHLCIRNCKTQRLLIDAPNLRSFSYILPDRLSEFPPPYETILNTPSLMLARLDTRCSQMSEHLGAVTSILGTLSNAELLKLYILCDQPKELHGVQLQDLPIFHKLKNVTVAFCEHACFKMVAWIINSLPNLKKLTLVEQPCHVHDMVGTMSESTDVSISLMVALTSCKELEIIEVKYQEGCERIVDYLVHSLIYSTKGLENLEIHLSKSKSCWKIFE